MEKDVKLGSFGSLDLSFSGGKASLGLSGGAPGGLSVSLSVVEDAGALIDLLKAAVEKAAPASAPIDEAVFAVLKSAVAAIA